MIRALARLSYPSGCGVCARTADQHLPDFQRTSQGVVISLADCIDTIGIVYTVPPRRSIKTATNAMATQLVRAVILCSDTPGYEGWLLAHLYRLALSALKRKRTQSRLLTALLLCSSPSDGIVEAASVAIAGHAANRGIIINADCV